MKKVGIWTTLQMTIPQTNFKLGYFINDHYSIAFEYKYVAFLDQTANMQGRNNCIFSALGYNSSLELYLQKRF
jgi:hypothetical protein